MKSKFKLNPLLLAVLFTAGSSLADPSSDENLLRRRPVSSPEHNAAEADPSGRNSESAGVSEPDLKMSDPSLKFTAAPAGYWNSVLSEKGGTGYSGIEKTEGRMSVSQIPDPGSASGHSMISSAGPDPHFISAGGGNESEHGSISGMNSDSVSSGSHSAAEAGVSSEPASHKSSLSPDIKHGTSGPGAAFGSGYASDLKAADSSGQTAGLSVSAESSGVIPQSDSRSYEHSRSGSLSAQPVSSGHNQDADRSVNADVSATAVELQTAEYQNAAHSGDGSESRSQSYSHKRYIQRSRDMPDEPGRTVSNSDASSVSHAGRSEKAPDSQKGNPYDLNRENIITVRRGVNEIIPVSLGYVNRIVTPFAHPEVVSSSVFSSADSCEEFCIRGNVIYITTSDTRPVAMFVTEQGRPEKSISITMIPKQIPPREVIFRFPAGEEASAGSASSDRGNDSAMHFEHSGDYITSIKKILKSAALNRIPEGYELHVTGEDQSVPFCEQSGLDFSFRSPGQYMKGYHFSVYIGVVRNKSDHEIEFDETSCSAPDVAAVAAWPKIFLFPGDKTELFVVRRLYHETGTEEFFRPNLLRGQ